MQEFWIENGWHFLLFGGIIIMILYAAIFYYTGCTKRLDLIVDDIEKYGEVSKEVIEFDRGYNSQGLDPGRLSVITHLFYIVPSKKKHPELYENYYFMEQLNFIKGFWIFFLICIILIICDATFIGIMTYLYGDNIN